LLKHAVNYMKVTAVLNQETVTEVMPLLLLLEESLVDVCLQGYGGSSIKPSPRQILESTQQQMTHLHLGLTAASLPSVGSRVLC